MTPPVPRPLPLIGGFSSPYVELRDHTLRLREHLEAAAQALKADLTDSPPEHLPPSVWNVKLYATAVTMFAAAAVEAAINQYGLMRFGAEQFEQHLAYDGPVKRLRRLLKCSCDLDLADDHPLVEALSSLSQRRNRLVHPRAHETAVDKQSVFRTPDAAWESPTHVSDADASIHDMNQFFNLFPNADPETATFLRPWSIRYR